MDTIEDTRTKVCRKCEQELPASAFSKHHKPGRPLPILYSKCKACKNAGYSIHIQTPEVQERRRQRERSRPKRKRSYSRSTNWINKFKAQHTCQICGEPDVCCLQFHHLDPSAKLFGVGLNGYQRKNRDEVKAEMRKCAILCANCHDKLHAGRFPDIVLTPVTIDE